MKTYGITLKSSRDDGRVRGTLILEIDAEDELEANEITSESLPAFDWKQWTSLIGFVLESDTSDATSR